MHVWIKVSILKNLYKTIRKGKENEERLLRIIDRLREQVPEEEELCTGKPFADIFGGIF